MICATAGLGSTVGEPAPLVGSGALALLPLWRRSPYSATSPVCVTSRNHTAAPEGGGQGGPEDATLAPFPRDDKAFATFGETALDLAAVLIG